MEATLVLVLFLTFMVGGMMLALVMGYRSIEEDRAQAEAQRAAESARLADMLAVPGFFKDVDGAQRPAATIVFDDALVARLEQHVRAEQAMVSQFVHYPSVESLYSKLDSSLNVH